MAVEDLGGVDLAGAALKHMAPKLKAFLHRRLEQMGWYLCSSWIFCTIYVCIPNVSLVVETASPLHACTVTVPCTHLLFSPLKSFSTSIVSPIHYELRNMSTKHSKVLTDSRLLLPASSNFSLTLETLLLVLHIK